MSRHFPEEGPQRAYRCPQCGSGDVECTLAAYEFTTLVCRSCGNESTMDDWQIERWFGPEGEDQPS